MPIERLTDESAAEAYQICQQSHPVPWSLKVFSDCLTPPYFAYQLEQSNTILGYYICLKVVDEVTLMDIAIAGNYRGHGYGKALLSHCLNQAILRKAATCWLEVRESNAPAIALYQAHGFKTIETRKGYYQTAANSQGTVSREDALVMQCIV